MKSFIVSGTDTGIGKTLLSAILMAGLPKYSYWKPIQSGTVDGADSETVFRLSGCSPERVLPEAYIFSQPLSPHAAAAIDGIKVDKEKLRLPAISPLIIEGAGGLLVPVTDDLLLIDLFKSWNVPLLLACRSGLGTINHTLLSLEALRRRNIPILGCVLIGEINESNAMAIEHYGAIRVIGSIPLIAPLNSSNVLEAYEKYLNSLTAIL